MRMGLGLGINRRLAGAEGGPAPISFLGQSINADGWSGTYASPPTFNPDGSPEYFTVTRNGFSTTGAATTYNENLIVTKRIRQVYPNEASLTTDQVSISRYVYNGNTIAGGATNNSTETSPKPVGNWARPDDRCTVGSTFPAFRAEVTAWHLDARDREQIACVEWRWSDGVNTVTHKESVSVISDNADDALDVIVYRPSVNVDISSLSDGQITMNAKVFPWYGETGAILDSADSSVAREFSPRTYTKTATGPRIGYVRTAANGGNDGTGVVSTNDATASASPFATVLACINAHHTAGGMDNTITYIGDDGGTPFVLGSTAGTRTQSTTECIITREPSVARANARVSFGAASFRPRFGTAGGWLRFKDVGIVRTGLNFIQGEITSNLVITFESVNFDNGSYNGSWLSNSHDRLIGVTFTNMSAAPLNASGSNEHRIIRGVTATGATNVTNWLVLGCSFTSSSTLQLNRGTLTRSGAITAFNRFDGPATSTAFLTPGLDENVTGFVFAQNILEYKSATSQSALVVTGDSHTGNLDHIIIVHNTCTGFNAHGRSNLFYDDGATPRTSRRLCIKGNIFVQINNKGDVFMTDGTRTGNWQFLHGVNCAGNLSQYLDAGSGAWKQDYPGLNASIGTSASVRNDPLFTSYQGTTSGPTAGSGGGTYTLQSGSPAADRLAPVLRFDLAGNTRNGTLTAAGAYRGFAEAA